MIIIIQKLNLSSCLQQYGHGWLSYFKATWLTVWTNTEATFSICNKQPTVSELNTAMSIRCHFASRQAPSFFITKCTTVYDNDFTICPLWPDLTYFSRSESISWCTCSANLVTTGRTADAHISMFYNDLKPSKVGQTDMVFGLWSGFISRSVHAGLQVSMCSSHDYG